MSRKAALEALGGGTLFLTFLAPSFRATRTAGSRQPQRALSGTAAPRTQSAAQVAPATDLPWQWDGRSTASSSGRDGFRAGVHKPQMDNTVPEDGPVASTSAVRLDSPSQQHSAHPIPALDDHAASCASRHAARDAAVDLPAVLARVRSAYLAAPASSPLDIIRRARASYADDESARQPPTPPPPIVLDPQPHSSRQGLLTPFLLQALFLGASALGLFARRKVRPRNEVAEQSAARRNAQRERQEAEDRVDELQALDLLVAAFAVPEASEPRSSQSSERGHAREERCWPLAQLLRKIEATQAPVSRQTVASVLHFVGPAAPHPASATATDASAPSRYSLARPVLGLWAWNAFSRLPSNPSSDPPDDAFLTAFLHLLYPSGRRVEHRHLFSSELDSTTDRSVLNAISTRLFPPSSSSPVSLGLLRAFARAAIRARRLDHLESVFRACRGLDSALRLLVAARGLEIISKDAHRRHHAAYTVRWAHHLVQAVRAIPELGREDIAVAGGAISRLISDFSIDRSLDPFIASALRALLRHEQAAAVVLEMPLVERVLRHLLHNPVHPSSQLALAVFDTIPPQLVTLAHYDTLLSSPFAPLVQAVWESLVAHKTLRPSAASVTLYLRPLAGRSAPPNALELTYSALQQLNHAGLSKTREMWHLVLRIAARRATDPAWLRLRHRMKREGFAPDHETAAIVVSRELVRRDVQLKRRVTLDTRTGERVETVVQSPRWRSGRTMVRRVREDARVWSERMRTLEQREGGEALREQVDVLPNLLVQGVAQATREYDLATVVKIVHARLGVDLGPLVDTPAEANVDLQAQLEKVKVEVPPPSMLKHREFARLRAPAYRISMSGLERRGRQDLAQVLEHLMRDEEALVGKTERDRRRAAKREAQMARGTPEIKAAIGRYREHGPVSSLSPLSGPPSAPAVDGSTSYRAQLGSNTSHGLEQPHASTSKPSPGARKETKVKRPIQAVGRGGGSKSAASSRGKKRKSRARSASSSDDDDEVKDSDDEEVMGFDPIGAPGSRVPRKAAQKARRAADGEVKKEEQDGKGGKRIKVE